MNNENTNALTLNEQIARDFAQAYQGKMEQALLDESVQKIKTMGVKGKVNASGHILTELFYTHVEVTTQYSTPVHKFSGDGGGMFSTGAGAFAGDIYTDDLNKLYRDTVSFQVNSTVVYLSVLFYDKNSHLLGHLQSGACSISIGIGGGKGSWK